MQQNKVKYLSSKDHADSMQTIFFFQNKEIFVQLDKLDKLDRITHAWIENTENILV